jgi:hypothetical protein
VERYTHFHKKQPGNTNHQRKPRLGLLTVKIQRTRRQRGVFLQSVSERLRSFIAGSVPYRHTRVERSKCEFSNTVPTGRAVGKVIATIATIALQYKVVLIVLLHNRLRTVQPVERYTHFHKKQTGNTNHQRKPRLLSPPKSSENEVSVVLSFRALANDFAPSLRTIFPTPEWGDSRRDSANQFQMGDTANRYVSVAIATIALDTRYSIDRVCFFTIDFEQPNQRSVLHTSTKDNQNTKSPRKPGDCSPPKISDNEVSVLFSFRASPNACAPSSPILFPTDTPEWRDSHTKLAKPVPMGSAANSYLLTTLATITFDTW